MEGGEPSEEEAAEQSRENAQAAAGNDDVDMRMLGPLKLCRNVCGDTRLAMALERVLSTTPPRHRPC